MEPASNRPTAHRDAPNKIERDGGGKVCVVRGWWQRDEFKAVKESSTCRVSAAKPFIAKSDKRTFWSRIFIHYGRILPDVHCKAVRPPEGEVVGNCFCNDTSFSGSEGDFNVIKWNNLI